MTFHVLTGEYPPQSGGVGSYTARLAAALGARGCAVHVWCPAVDDGESGPGVRTHRLPDSFGARSQAALEEALARDPGCLLLQYVPNALGARGVNVPFCRWLRGLRRRGADVRVMFHEPYFYFTVARPLRNALAVAQRAMAAILLRASTVAYLSTETWIRYLRPYAPASTSFVALPIPSTLPDNADEQAARAWRARTAGAAALAGHFGTYGDDVTRVLEPALIQLLGRHADVHVLLVGHRSADFRARVAAAHPSFRDRLHASGTLAECDAAAALTACDVLLQPYPDGVTTRRTSVMAGLALGVATVTTDGELTEAVWRETRAARLVPAGDADAAAIAVLALLADRDARLTQAAQGRRAYRDRFSIDHAVDALLTARATPMTGV